ncbi:uncharacterized protein LOC142523915 [Primulina tabacum]|uniref:uncharacterized protein LOC142523915 n=1 Tax=Primulina tabacum TaxID=48773 RepID=UPI003F59776D
MEEAGATEATTDWSTKREDLEDGHKAADCLKKKGSTVGRAYVMHAEEVEDEPDTTLITGVTIYALLDSGATQSFIFETFVKRLNIILEDMGLSFKVSIPSDDQMITSSIVNNLELRLQKDVRSVSIRPPRGRYFVFEAARNKQMPHIISCMCAKKLMKRGCQDFLACVMSSLIPDNQKLEDVEVVRDYRSVFPEEFSGSSSDREVEFSFELMSGTVPISKPLYRLAPVETKELKDQIQELLDKGFYSPYLFSMRRTGTICEEKRW